MLGSKPALGTAAFADLEVGRGLMVDERAKGNGSSGGGGQTVQTLIHTIEYAILALVQADVERQPDTRIVHWILYCR